MQTCDECVRRGVGEERREIIINRAVAKLIKEVSRDTGKMRDKSDWMGRVVGQVATPEELDRLCAQGIRRALESQTSWKAPLDAIKLIKEFKSLADEGRDNLKDSLAQLSDEDLLQLGMGLITRALAVEGNIELLEELASQFGYRLVPISHIEGSAVPVEASA